MRRCSSSIRPRTRRGVAAVECALLLPLLCFLFIATVDFARVFYYSLTVSNCARNGAVYGSADKTHALDTAGIRTAAQADAKNLSLQSLTVSSSTDSSTDPTKVTVTVSYPFTTISQYPGIPRQTNLTYTVRMSVVPLTPSFK